MSDFEKQVDLLMRHIRGAMMGEPIPSIDSQELRELLDSINGAVDQSVANDAARIFDLARIGLLAIGLLRDRLVAGCMAERQMRLISCTQKPS